MQHDIGNDIFETSHRLSSRLFTAVHRRPARAGLCDIVYNIVYNIEYTNTDIVYDIDIRYCISINMEDYGLVLSYVYIVPLFLPELPFEGISQMELVPSEEWEGSSKPGRGLLD